VDTCDGAAELFDLETLGFEPARLARHVWLRSAFVLAAGLLGGLVTGLAASLLVTEVVAVTANATTPEPPLVAVLGWTQLAAGLVGFCVVALASVALLARRSFRGATAARPETA
jgi:ABC-type lipoprotein release transport system permease subunit